MEKVLGFGGFFFRADKPIYLMRWYHDNLGIDMPPSDYDQQPWRQTAGTTIFLPFERTDTHFGGPTAPFMFNFRVRDLDAMVAQLRANGNVVTVDENEYPNGRFAQLNDPEGNPIQLWQPGGVDSP
ncbi:MAG: VOC family protein [Chloroflexi bacterium]|jgi:catechol 2,3-dioxygenase-like lactoylglutathione lyase family enzyme|nr:VOC family protein [Chloroflexota bacterium]MBV6438259.1 hypothetical protein [Anaerolineae bacterium]MDL1915199.1 VOC family protein [Anaerolineae bacterium CFX4]OQY76983.1 MAG: glyoxalase [Anaerolineae bacterium UTCFX5]MEB2366539.1 VOC family protein [Chloroflexota bacterium]